MYKIIYFAGAVVLALAGCRNVETERRIENEFSLDGRWSFKLVANEGESPAGEFWRNGFDVLKWGVARPGSSMQRQRRRALWYNM